MDTELSVVLINYHSARLLDRALDSLCRAEPELAYEVLVVDNASGERNELVRICRRHGARLLLLTRNSGYGAAFNRGLHYARGSYVAVANSDITFGKGAASRLLEFLTRNPGAGAAGPQLFYPDGTAQPSARRFPRLRYVLAGRRSPLIMLRCRSRMTRDFQYLGIEKSIQPQEVEALVGAFVVFRREALDQVNGFDDRYFMFAEDMDIARRLRRCGWLSFVVPMAKVEHRYGATRRRFVRFTEFHRVRALTRFLAEGRSPITAALIWSVGAWYYFLLEAASQVGVLERELSWRGRDST